MLSQAGTQCKICPLNQAIRSLIMAFCANDGCRDKAALRAVLGGQIGCAGQCLLRVLLIIRSHDDGVDVLLLCVRFDTASPAGTRTCGSEATAKLVLRTLKNTHIPKRLSSGVGQLIF